MKRVVCIAITAILIISLFGGCTSESGELESDVIEINPTEGASNKEKVCAMLYYANLDYSMLAGEEREIDVPVSQRQEYSVLEKLIAGPSQNGAYFNCVINPSTRIVSMSEENGILSVNLSKDFLDWGFITYPDISEKLDTVKQLAVYSIVNTLVEVSGIPRVQLFVDREGNGTSQRINLSEVGMGPGGVLESLGRNGAVVLSAQRTLQIVFNAWKNKNYDDMYDYITYLDEDGNERMDESTFVNRMKESGVSIGEFSVVEIVESADSNRQIFMVDYITVSSSAEQKAYTNVPVKLVKENAMWKLTESTIENLIL